MKKHIKAIAAVISLSIAFSGLSVSSSAAITSEKTSAQTYNSNTIVGGWSINYDSTSLSKNPDAKSAFLKARKAVTDISIQPIAYLGSQVVSGRNYCFLCKLTAVSSDSRPEIALVYIYEDLKGNAKIIGYQTIIGKVLPGGFSANEGKFKLSNNKAVKMAYKKAMKDNNADGYEPIAYLGDQVVSGINYMILARGKGTDEVAEGLYLIVIYADLNGNAEINRIEALELGNIDDDTDTTTDSDSIIGIESQSFIE
ncbi:hypothetical protein [Ruminococcus sp.]|uniref:hypothetical protein n=1 Tax=Ruminococcus sp. TaxID=41978 RepID=UPI00258A76D0|nr:hypothetical protein [Ruminococcus sp.]MCR5021100.1 hypothetical protein [Ruminococcus sp.]